MVAGCLFEVALPAAGDGSWRWANTDRDVTLVGEAVSEGWQHLRFRAEAAGAQAGLAELRFVQGDAEHVVAVRIAPEELGRVD